VIPTWVDVHRAIRDLEDSGPETDQLLYAAERRPRDRGLGTYLMFRPLLFHWTMIRGDFEDMIRYLVRCCYVGEAGAMAAPNAFPDNPPKGYEPAGWHRPPSTGRRRPNGDPARDYRDVLICG